jgi:bifunctional DNA-binding transcriptional regulator/antitoxin component of YhaV-PrlF toxin-antitoxin module
MNRYTIDIKETPEKELYFNLPDELMSELDWHEGDDLKFIDKGTGSFLIKKKTYATIELEFDDDELFKYMRHAHEQNMSFNEWIEHALESIIEANNK